MTIKEYENYGIVSNLGQPVLTYEVQSSMPDDESLELTSFMGGGVNGVARVDNYSIALYGAHNNLPYELKQVVKANRLLPEILEKQRRYLYGKGPYFYIEQPVGDDKVIRVPAINKFPDAVRRATRWIENWEEMGAKDDFKSYVRKQINEFYYCENVFSKFQMNLSRRIGGDIPVRYLEHIPNNRARLATRKNLTEFDTVEMKDFNRVLIGDWFKYWRKDKLSYPLLDRSDRLKYPVAVAMDKNDSFGEDIYGFPAWYYGLKDWIKASNLNPKYINSFLKNSLGAKIHVLIPNSWCKKYEDMLRAACLQNSQREDDGKPLIKFGGVLEIGTEYRDEYLDKLINIHLNKITQLMSGEGKNQGKLWASRKFMGPEGTEEWEFKEIPTKVKEYIETLTKLDERADQVLLEGKGMDPSLSNVSKEGIISKSGADLYYNYLLYLDNLQIPEEIVLKHINEALALNFPEMVSADIRMGFYHNVIQRQEDVQPESRMNKTVQS